MDLTVFVPTRGRAKVLAPFMENWRKVTSSSARVVWVIDEDDPQKGLYYENHKSVVNGTHDTYLLEAPESARGMVGALNLAFRSLENSLGFAVGFMGDDHRPRTEGWDHLYVQHLRAMKTGFVYGDDLYQGETIPTQIAMTTDIPEALGWMAPPTFHHLFVDNAWKDLGKAVDRIKYLPNVVVEHDHPLAGKGNKKDKNYAIVNSAIIANHDKAAYDEWKANDFIRDVERIKSVL